MTLKSRKCTGFWFRLVLSAIIMLTMLVRLVVMLGGGDLLCFNDATIERTKLFRYIYNFMGA